MFTTSPSKTARTLCIALLFAGGRLAAEDATRLVTGTLRDAAGRPVAGARVVLDDGTSETRSGASGEYQLEATVGTHRLRVLTSDYVEAARDLEVAADLTGVDFTLAPPYRIQEDVVVRAIRADERAPITATGLDRPDLERQDFGQEMPVLLKQQPSMTFYSDNGTGFGYSYFYLRGIQQTRINMTVDGVPLTDAEDSALYFVDFADFTSSLESLQIQRGVGTSSVGAASFGGSINFASIDLADKPQAEADLGAGSFGSYRASLGLQSGSFGPGLALYARGSYQTTDGFRDNSGVTQRSLFYGARWQGQQTLVRVFGFVGHEETQEAFLAEEPDVLAQNLRANPLSPEERDSFGQRLVRAQVTRFLSAHSSLAVQGYYNGAGGWYRLWDDETAKTQLLQYGLDWRYLGGMVTFQHADHGFAMTLGAHGYDFRSTHTQDVVGGEPNYSNDNIKNEASGFLKLSYDRSRWHLFGDAQLRWARFEYVGSEPLGSIAWTFLNPKLGVRRDLSPVLSAYASVGKASREPARSDMLAGEDNASIDYDLGAVKPERVVDFEGGVDYRTRHLALAGNLYAMEFRNEIALTGELSAIGLPLRRNVDRSYRRGLELDARWQPGARWRLTGNANLSHNRIDTWPQSYDVYDAAGNYVGSQVLVSKDVSPLLTPTFTLNLGGEWTPRESLGLGLAFRHVASSFLDNTDQPDLKTPAVTTLDLTGRVSFGRWVRHVRPQLRIWVTNLLDDRHLYVSGYSYLFFTEDAHGGLIPGGTAYYYPQATRGVFARLEFGF